MKTKFVLYLLVSFVISCNTPAYVVKPEFITQNVYGSYIKVMNKSGILIKGELISVTNDSLFIFQKYYLPSIVTVSQNNIKWFRLKYAKERNYGWTIPTYTIGFIPFHGFYSILSIPINLLVTTWITVSSSNAFTYTKKDIPFQELKMFARFPQGIPDNIKLSDIK